MFLFSYQVKPYLCTNNGFSELNETEVEDILSESYVSVEGLRIKEEKLEDDINNGAPIDVKEVFKHEKSNIKSRII